jgi:hypothetical protein
MKEPYYYLVLTDFEHGVILKSLADEKNALLSEGRTADVIDELIVKVGEAPVKNFRVVERSDYADAR